MGKIVASIGYSLVVLFFVIMIISGLAIWLSLLLLIFVKSDMFDVFLLFSVIMLIISYQFIYRNSYLLFNNSTNNKICDFIESINYSRFLSIISFLFYNSLLLHIYITSYKAPIKNNGFWTFSYMPILNLHVYIILIKRYKRIDPNYSFSKFFSLYLRGQLIYKFIKDAKRMER
jgi:hypothetical protein